MRTGMIIELKSSLSLLNECSKALLVVNGKLGKHLAVKLDTGLAQTVHKAAVIDAVCTAGGGNTGNPKLSEISLFQSASDVRILTGLHNGFFRCLELPALAAVISLGELENLLSSLAGHHCALNMSHICILLKVSW